MKEKLKFDVPSLAEYLKKTLNMKTDGNCCQINFSAVKYYYHTLQLFYALCLVNYMHAYYHAICR